MSIRARVNPRVLDQRVRFERLAEPTPSASGEPAASWGHLCTCWAKVDGGKASGLRLQIKRVVRTAVVEASGAEAESALSGLRRRSDHIVLVLREVRQLSKVRGVHRLSASKHWSGPSSSSRLAGSRSAEGVLSIL
jgi:hypothetical protein